MTGKKVEQQLERCLEAFREGSLSEEMLQAALEAAHGNEAKCQDILYLQAVSTSLASQVQGMLLIENGEIAEEIPDPEDWPYQTVLEAVRDGWRVVQFPNLALLLDETRTYGLGCEFILER
ncbi:MAG: hypothetical protein OXG26_09980 [Caldilineaceae bacterium]|nr:hypothetical protein [Caldilineaceae bacterium]MDE0631621.1 hypothetical protein [Caldilineaceae bacterium]MXZ22752.1 hypothetical protein [Caldilineaceae bacterium SB0665_bin_25]